MRRRVLDGNPALKPSEAIATATFPTEYGAILQRLELDDFPALLVRASESRHRGPK